MRRLISIAAAASIMAAGLAGALPSAASAASSPAAGIKWGTCSDPSLQQVNAQCGFLSVPLDYSNPGGAKIQLAVSRIKHTSRHYQGIILTNPGGPVAPA